MGKKKPRPRSQAAPGTSKVDSVNSQVISALNAVTAPVPLLKVCRLCESKDGPFLNIFGVEQAIAQKIADLMPFSVSEYDDLPHKICFRCSAKVEELHDFVEKCVKTQESLLNALGKKGTLQTKSKTRKIWEEKLNQSNMSNDELCDAVIKQAMKGIIDMPPSPPEAPPEPNIKPALVNFGDVNPPAQSTAVKEEKKPNLRAKRSSMPVNPEIPPQSPEKPRLTRQSASPAVKNILKVADIGKLMPTHSTIPVVSDDEDSNDSAEAIVPESMKPNILPAVEKKPFNIQDYICTIKVNGVGTLHQCKLCNRNFLSHEFIMNHGCAKSGVPKIDNFSSSLKPIIDPPKNPMASVRYINNRTNDKVAEVQNTVEPPKPEPVMVDKSKSKPKIGPASRVKKTETLNADSAAMRNVSTPATAPRRSPSPPSAPQPAGAPQHAGAPHFIPTIDIPGMNSRYRLVPGPNNTFTLIEDPPRDTNQSKQAPNKPSAEQPPEPDEVKHKKKKDKGKTKKPITVPELLDNIIDLDDDPPLKGPAPYPVGLFQAAPQQEAPSAPVTFTTPAMKKQSYQVVQTGNPSKLLISSKPQPVDPPRPKSKRKHKETRDIPESDKQPFTLTLEESTKERDPAFFTFVNVDPLLQPSYVLPTDNIIQESQISTSSAVTAPPPNPNKPYSCNLCPETFSREKKLLVHIQAHYNKMDEEDSNRHDKYKRTRRS